MQNYCNKMLENEAKIRLSATIKCNCCHALLANINNCCHVLLYNINNYVARLKYSFKKPLILGVKHELTFLINQKKVI